MHAWTHTHTSGRQSQRGRARCSTVTFTFARAWFVVVRELGFALPFASPWRKFALPRQDRARRCAGGARRQRGIRRTCCDPLWPQMERQRPLAGCPDVPPAAACSWVAMGLGGAALRREQDARGRAVAAAGGRTGPYLRRTVRRVARDPRAHQQGKMRSRRLPRRPRRRRATCNCKLSTYVLTSSTGERSCGDAALLLCASVENFWRCCRRAHEASQAT